jgi:hypothetical protein
MYTSPGLLRDVAVRFEAPEPDTNAFEAAISEVVRKVLYARASE